MIKGEIIMCSRKLPEVGPSGTGDWVFVDTPSQGGTIARLHHKDGQSYWEEREAGRTLRLEQVVLWAKVISWD